MRILLILLLLTSVAKAGDFGEIIFRDSITPADTLAEALRVDTIYSKKYKLDGATNYQFGKNIYSGNPPDTNWASDTFFVDFQHSFDGVNWRTWLVDTAVTTDGWSWSVLNISSLDSVVGGFGRARLIHWDSTETTTMDGLAGNVYVTKLNLWINKIGGTK